MKLHEDLRQLRQIKRKQHHFLINKLHEKNKISKRTLFYVKEYSDQKVIKTILKESIKILIFCAILGVFGGLAIERIKIIFVAIVPLVILMPILNDMIGDYGIIISSKFSTLLHKQLRLDKNYFKNQKVKKIFFDILFISFITAILAALSSLAASFFIGFSFDLIFIFKVIAISVIDTLILIIIMYIIAINYGTYIFRRKEDPSNYLIPVTTSIADFGNVIVLMLLVRVFF